jgi:hypothetical protein
MGEWVSFVGIGDEGEGGVARRTESKGAMEMGWSTEGKGGMEWKEDEGPKGADGRLAFPEPPLLLINQWMPQ